MTRWSWRSIVVTLVLAAAALPRPAAAFPTYSRKYATSCGTCHSIYPKLTQFGEAFRRNGYRFPGVVDSDYIKQEVVPMGQEVAKKDFPNSTWPSFITSPPALGFLASTRVTIHPDRQAAAALKDNQTVLSMDSLGTSGTLFASGDIDDNITFLGLIGMNTTGTTLDQTQLMWNDVFGVKYPLNLTAGYTFPTLTPFGRGSAYTKGQILSGSALGTAYGWASAPFKVTAKYNLVEANGILFGRVEYGAGVAAGTHDGVRPPGNFYGHLAYKLGGMRLDGLGDTVAQNPAKPWQETSLTVWGFAYRSRTDVVRAAATGVTAVRVADLVTTVGGGVRGQVGSAELTLGGLFEDHPHIGGTLGTDNLPIQVSQVSAYGELAYTIFPWLVPAVRVEQTKFSPRGAASSTGTRFLATLATQPRTNMKLSVTASAEKTDGPMAAGGDWSKLSGDGFNQPKTVTKPVDFEVSVVTVSASFGF